MFRTSRSLRLPLLLFLFLLALCFFQFRNSALKKNKKINKMKSLAWNFFHAPFVPILRVSQRVVKGCVDSAGPGASAGFHYP